MSRTRAEWILPTSMLIGTFAWSFVYVSLPFHIQRMSTLEPSATLRWTGWILGISPLITRSCRRCRPPRSTSRWPRWASLVPLVARMDRRSRLRDDPGGGMTS